MDTKTDWVLVTGDSRGAVAAVRALAAAGCRPAVTTSGSGSMAGASRFCARRIRVPDAALDPTGYAAAIRAEADRTLYLAILPATDAAITALALPEARLMDKVAWAPMARDAGLAVPPTAVFGSREELAAAADRLDFPIVAKPNLKRFTAQYLAGPQDLDRVPDVPGRLLVQPYLRDPMHGMIGLAWHGRLVAATQFRYERVWPFPCGTVSAAETVVPDEALIRAFERLLVDFDGIFHADLAGPYLLDLNPRIHATLPLAAAAGTDLIALYCGLLRGHTVGPARGRPGIFFRWLEGDTRSIVRGVRDGRLGLRDAVRAGRPRRGEVHGVESLTDPLPMLQRLHKIPGAVRRQLARGRNTPPVEPRTERGPS